MPRGIKGLDKEHNQWLISKGVPAGDMAKYRDMTPKINHPKDSKSLRDLIYNNYQLSLKPVRDKYSAYNETGKIYHDIKKSLKENTVYESDFIKEADKKYELDKKLEDEKRLLKLNVKPIPKVDQEEDIENYIGYESGYLTDYDAPNLRFRDNYDSEYVNFQSQKPIKRKVHKRIIEPEETRIVPYKRIIEPEETRIVPYNPQMVVPYRNEIERLVNQPPQLTTVQEVVNMASGEHSYVSDAADIGSIGVGLATENPSIVYTALADIGQRAVKDIGQGVSKVVSNKVDKYVDELINPLKDSKPVQEFADGRIYNNTKMISQTEEGVISYKGSEYMQDITSNTTSFLLTTIPVNPGLVYMPVVSAIASNFSYYRVNKLKFIYKPTSGDGSSSTLFRLGSIQMAINNPIESAPTSKLQMSQYSNSVIGRPIQEISLTLPFDDRWYSVRTNTTFRQNEDLRLTDISRLYINVCNMMAGNQVCGELYCEYSFDFKQIDYNANSAIGNQNAIYLSKLVNQTGTFAAYMPTTAGGSNYGGDPQASSNISGITFPTGASISFPAVYQNGSVFKVLYQYSWTSIASAATNGPIWNINASSGSSFVSDNWTPTNNPPRRWVAGNMYNIWCIVRITGAPHATYGHLYLDSTGNPAPTLPTTQGFLLIEQLPSSFAIL